MLKSNTVMNTSTILLMSCVALVTFGIISKSEQLFASSSEGRTIILVPKPTTPQETPRSPEESPFIAELMDGSNSVLLGATDTIGIVSVQITSTAGDNYSTYFDTSDGAILLPISGNAGYYTLTIITPDGTHYVGEFTI